ncbi:gamma-glutamyl-gamma-aminobutyrate hydrolase family protein [Propionibacteriaceae bacterium Y1700]|uniref:gamma-glutamyl-gamma-aminobutyrate hydrolase family protein n=1 Tax=Microlunatus sp. Y1700 TaxID=3418487 RepID=UPI003DA70D33
MSPRILLTAGHKTPTEPYVRAIVAGGGEPVVMLPGDGLELPDRIDGYVLAGGASVEPVRYGATIDEGLTPTMDLPRDEMEFALLEQALDHGLPVLAICRGFQLINVYYGGTLHQELTRTNYTDPHRNDLPRTTHAHTVTACAGRLRSIMGSDPYGVNSIHKQGVRDVAPGLVVTGHSSDGLIEGLETVDGQVVAVQWHPEELVDTDSPALGLFTDLVDRIRARELAVAPHR